nr:type IV-A pilus assembly ATPase PilB [Halomonas halocynthiae]
MAEEHSVDPTALLVAEQQARQSGVTLLKQVVSAGLLSASQAAECAGREYGLSVVNPESLPLSELPPASDFPAQLLRNLNALPIRRSSHKLLVAVPCPSLLAGLHELQFATGLEPEGVLAPTDQWERVFNAYLANSEDTLFSQLGSMDEMNSALDEFTAQNSLENGEESHQAVSSEEPLTSNDAPVVRYINNLLLDAIRQGASDIHVEPYESSFRVRFRIDGLLHDVAHPPFALRARMAARLKIMARLDISERRLPQDGAIKLKLSETRAIDLRVNSLPTVFGEKLVLRILDSSSTGIPIEQLGLSERQQALYEHALSRPQGMILVTGPTGSGKTVTLYTGLSLLNDTSRNICTAEDPVEIKVAGINQVQVLPRIGLDFASALRAFLRQDPDVVMVGEIRDVETAEIAARAAQTGHMVLSTVHTNSAAETITRLSDMGVAAFNIANSVKLIISQRLARRLCNACKRPARYATQALLDLGCSTEEATSAKLFEAVGCQHCTQGYKGRLGIYEVFPIDGDLSQQIMAGASAKELAEAARRQGHLSLQRSAVDNALLGLTSLAEIHRVITDL